MVIVSGETDIRIHRDVKGLSDKLFGGYLIIKDMHDEIVELFVILRDLRPHLWLQLYEDS